MREAEILEFIKALKSGALSECQALKTLKNYPFEDVGCAKIDTQRGLRNGVGEVIFGLGKSDEEVVKIALAMCERGQDVLITRTNRAVFELLCAKFGAKFVANKDGLEAKFNLAADDKFDANLDAAKDIKCAENGEFKPCTPEKDKNLQNGGFAPNEINSEFNAASGVNLAINTDAAKTQIRDENAKFSADPSKADATQRLSKSSAECKDGLPVREPYGEPNQTPNRKPQDTPMIKFNERGGVITIKFSNLPLTKSYIAIVSAGTADGAIVEEAYETARFLGNDVRKFNDVGVAGLHRLIAHIDEIRGARAVIAVAGMEGALASVVAGLVSVPVIAVPTSVGYGASFGGVAALLAMLNSCANGVSVVNIDNGYGAAYSASLINHL